MHLLLAADGIRASSRGVRPPRVGAAARPPDASSRLKGARDRRLDRKDTVTLSLSHKELARMAGMTRSHVTVTLGRLRRRGLLRYVRQGPLRVDVAALTLYLGRIVSGEE